MTGKNWIRFRGHVSATGRHSFIVIPSQILQHTLRAVLDKLPAQP
jgi:hypothetical protein